MREKIQEHPVLLTQERSMTRFEASGALMTKAIPNLQILMTTNLQLNSPQKVLNCPKKVTLSPTRCPASFPMKRAVCQWYLLQIQAVSRNIFSDDHRKYLLKLCGGMVKSGVISQTAVKDMLGKEEEGKAMLREFKLKQIIDRLKYKRRLNQKK